MSPRARRRDFTMLPNRFIDAEMRGDLTPRRAKLCRYIARHKNANDEAHLTLAKIENGMHWEESRDTLRRDLKALRPQWFDFDSGPGMREPYCFRLTGLRVDRGPVSEESTSAQPPQNLRTTFAKEPPQELGLEEAESRSRSGDEPPHDSADSARFSTSR